jgi:glutathione S-transferase
VKFNLMKVDLKTHTIERYRLIEMLAFISSEIHKAFEPIFSPDGRGSWRAPSGGRSTPHR